MVNFTESLQLGIQTALDRERNFQEIHDVFFSLREQIIQFSKESLTLEMILRKEDRDDESPPEDYFNNFKKLSKELYLDKNLFLSDINNLDENYERLSSLVFSPNGYPCTLEIDGNNFDSIDKISLEENIKKLLSAPSTGQKLFQLMKSVGKL